MVELVLSSQDAETEPGEVNQLIAKVLQVANGKGRPLGCNPHFQNCNRCSPSIPKFTNFRPCLPECLSSVNSEHHLP